MKTSMSTRRGFELLTSSDARGAEQDDVGKAICSPQVMAIIGMFFWDGVTGSWKTLAGYA